MRSLVSTSLLMRLVLINSAWHSIDLGVEPVDPKQWNNLKVVEYPSKKWEETDVEIAITHCGYVWSQCASA